MRIRLFYYIMAAVSALLMASCTEEKRDLRNPKDIYHEKYFNLVLPPGFKITKMQPVEDFEIYTITTNSELYVGVYLGNYPQRDLPTNFAGWKVVKKKSGNRQMTSVWAGDELRYREILIHIENTNLWPEYLHAWVNPSLSNGVTAADAILSSIELE